jgi:TolA-binding protein
MKFLLLLFFTLTQLFSLTITLNSAKEENSEYAVLHIEDEEPINCQSIPRELGQEVYLCQFNKIVKAPIEAKRMKLVEIDFLEKEQEFFIKIEPKVKSKLIYIKSSLYEETEISDKVTQDKYKHWSVLLYEKEPFKKTKSEDNIDFPITYHKELKPYIGALDLNGVPISYAQSKDIKLYLDIKKAFENKMYQDAIEDSIKTIKTYPQTIFKGEILLYRIKALDLALDNPENDISEQFDRSDVVKEAKAWVRAFPSNENLPEVLMIIAKSYLAMGQKSDANYFLDILISEHEDSLYTKKGILLFADDLYNTRQKEKALKLYKDVLYSAQDLDVAAEAAIRLVDKEVDRGKGDEAREYLLKVLNANETFLLKDRTDTYRLAEKLANNRLYDIAARLVDVLLKDVKKIDEQREVLMRDSGLWHAKANEITLAYDALQQYLNEYKTGDFTDEVQSAMDELFFELNETNETKLANYYDTLIEKYKNHIGDKAVVEKAKLLLSQKRYEDVLKMQDILLHVSDDNGTEVKELIAKAASSLTKNSMNEDDCAGAVQYIEEYKLPENSFEAQKIYECLMRSSRYEKAKEISQTKAQDTNLSEKKLWLENYLSSLYYLSDYENVVMVYPDISSLATALKVKTKYDSLKYTFLAYLKLDKFEKALELTNLLEKYYPNDFRNSDIFYEIVKVATDTQDDLLLVKYAKKVIDLQNKAKKYIQTPHVEFSYIIALKRLNKNKEALTVAQDLLKKQLQDIDKARAYYYGAEISLKDKNTTQAKEYFEKCTQVKDKSSWSDICEQNLKLL